MNDTRKMREDTDSVLERLGNRQAKTEAQLESLVGHVDSLARNVEKLAHQFTQSQKPNIGAITSVVGVALVVILAIVGSWGTQYSRDQTRLENVLASQAELSFEHIQEHSHPGAAVEFKYFQTLIDSNTKQEEAQFKETKSILDKHTEIITRLENQSAVNTRLIEDFRAEQMRHTAKVYGDGGGGGN